MRCRRDRELFALSYRYSASSRPMNLVRMASLWAARRMAAQLVGRQAHGGAGGGTVHAFHLEQNFARPDHRHPLFRGALTFAHTGFGGLLGDGLIGEQPY